MTTSWSHIEPVSNKAHGLNLVAVAKVNIPALKLHYNLQFLLIVNEKILVKNVKTVKSCHFR